MKASEYVVMNDGVRIWPARREDADRAFNEGRDPWGDGAVPVPPELMPKIGYGVGSQECIELCMALLDAGADEYRA